MKNVLLALLIVFTSTFVAPLQAGGPCDNQTTRLERLTTAQVAAQAAPEAVTVSKKVPFVEQTIEEAASRNFRVQLRKAIRQAARDGKISRREARVLQVASISPAFCEQAKQLAIIQMAASGEADDYLPLDEDGNIDEGRIDWDGLIKFLEALLPLILQLLMAFGVGI
jgi:hypothetical protein